MEPVKMKLAADAPERNVRRGGRGYTAKPGDTVDAHPADVAFLESQGFSVVKGAKSNDAKG